jgi:hypothetical protein
MPPAAFSLIKTIVAAQRHGADCLGDGIVSLGYNDDV